MESKNNTTYQIYSRHEYDAIVKSRLPVLFGFFDEPITCHKTPRTEPFFHKLGEELKEKITFVKVNFKDCVSPIEDYIKKKSPSNYKGNYYPQYPFFYQGFFNQELVSESQKSDEVNIKKMAHECIKKAEDGQLTNNYFEVPEIKGHEVEEFLFNSKRPFLIHFHSNKIECVIKNPLLFFGRLANELQGAVRCVRVDTTKIDDVEKSIMVELGVEVGDYPAVVAAYVEDGCPKAFKIFTKFDYNEIIDACVELYKEKGKPFESQTMNIWGEIMAKENEVQIKCIKNTQEIDEILAKTKRPVFIYTHNKQISNLNKRTAQKHFKERSLSYQGRITFLQIDENDKVMPEVFEKEEQNFAGFFNKQIFGPIQIDENVIGKINAMLVNLATEPHLPTDECDEMSKLCESKKPIIYLLYKNWEMKSLKRGIQFNNIYMDLKKEEKDQDFNFFCLDYKVGYKKPYPSTIMGFLKIDRHFPALVGFFKGECKGKVDAREKEADIMEKFQPVVDELKSKKK